MTATPGAISDKRRWAAAPRGTAGAQGPQSHAAPTAPAAWPVIALLALLLFAVEPALANKFETIGGGFSGASGDKREFLNGFFLIAGGLSLLGGILAVITPHSNPLYMNYNNWKQSAVVLFLLAGVFFLIAGLI